MVQGILTVVLLIPFSKRDEASDRKFKRPAVRRMLTGRKTAASRATFSVASVWSVLPPMTPPMATGWLPSVITMSPVSAGAGGHLKRWSRPPWPGGRGAADLSQSNHYRRRKGPAVFQHNVVSHINQAVNRPHASCHQLAPSHMGLSLTFKSSIRRISYMGASNHRPRHLGGIPQ